MIKGPFISYNRKNSTEKNNSFDSNTEFEEKEDD